MSASIRRVQRILHWFESQHQLAFYASSLLFVYEGLPSSLSSSSLSCLLTTPSISPPPGDEEKGRQEGAGQKEKEEVAEYNNNNIQVAMPWDYSLATIYTNHRKGGLHNCTKSHLLGNSGDGDTVEKMASSVSREDVEDNSAWKRTGEPPREAPNTNGNKSQLEGKDEEEEREDGGGKRREEEEETEGQDVKERSGGDAEVEVRMIDFAHVFPSESHDRGYIYGLKHLLTVLEQILCDAT